MLKISKRPGSPFWQITGTCPYTRERVRISTRTDRESEAKDILTAHLARSNRTAIHGPESATLVAEAVLEYVDKGGDARFLGPILEHLGKRRMVDIEDQDLSGLARLVYPNAKPSTLCRQLYGPMQAVWNAAERAKMVSYRRFAKPKVKREPAKYADDVWLMKVLKALTRLEQRAAVLFMSFTGTRASEVVRVKVKNHDRERGTVEIETTKTGKPRLVYLPPFVNDALSLLSHEDPEAPLFGYTQRFAFNTFLKRACERAGVPYLSSHKVGRHSFAARLLKDGASLQLVKEAGGWASISVVSNTYAHLERPQIEQAVRGVSTPVAARLAQISDDAPKHQQNR